jgi:DNA-binding MarR family transcriptional regulator
VQQSDGAPVLPSFLASELGKSKPTITKMIDKLIIDRLLVKSLSQVDRREKILTLTEEGEDLLNRIIPGYNRRIEEMSSSLTVSDKDKLLKILSKINFLDPDKIIKAP